MEFRYPSVQVVRRNLEVWKRLEGCVTEGNGGAGKGHGSGFLFCETVWQNSWETGSPAYGAAHMWDRDNYFRPHNVLARWRPLWGFHCFAGSYGLLLSLLALLGELAINHIIITLVTTALRRKTFFLKGHWMTLLYFVLLIVSFKVWVHLFPEKILLRHFRLGSWFGWWRGWELELPLALSLSSVNVSYAAWNV